MIGWIERGEVARALVAPGGDRLRHLAGVEDRALQRRHLLERGCGAVVARMVQRELGAGDRQRRLGRDRARDGERVRQRRLGVGQHGIHEADGERALGADALAAVRHLAGDGRRDDLGQALQHAEVGRHADVDLLHAEEGVGAGVAQVARGGEVERPADAAALHRAQDRKARRVERIEAGHQAAQALLEAQPRAGGAGRQCEVAARKDVESHAGAEVLAGRRDHEHACRAGVAQALYGVAQRGEEGRRERVHPLGADEPQVGDGAFGAQLEEFVHRLPFGQRLHDSRGPPAVNARAARRS